MSTRHEKNVLRKERVRERRNALARALRSTHLRPINTIGLQTLQKALGLALIAFSPLDDPAQSDGFRSESESLDKEDDSRAVSSNAPDIPFNEGAEMVTSDLDVPTARNFGSEQYELVDAIFIAIDFEHSHYSPKTGNMRLREVGIAMFDTRDFLLENVISTRHYRTVIDTKKEFLFGKTIDTVQDELILILKRLFYLENESNRPIRNLILVGHGFGFEVEAMKGLGIDLNLAPSVIEIFDTEFLEYEVFGRGFKSSLRNVVRETGTPGKLFHNAGNDANFSLRAMLRLAIYRYNTLETDGILRSRLDMYRKLAQF